MAKRIITTILQNYCGRYLDGISSDNIEASVWSGEVSLKNLKIKPQALDFLELPVPVKIRKGHIGTLDAVVPYTALSSQSTTITINDVFLTVVPRAHANVDNYTFETFKQELEEQWSVKLNRIDVADILRRGMKKEAENQALSGIEAEEESSFFQGLITTVVENLVVNIKDIHFRYEDRISYEHPFCLGFMIHDFSIYTTNAHGKKIFVETAYDDNNDFDDDDGNDYDTKQNYTKVINTHKRAHVEGFAIYWSTKKKFRSLASLSTPQWRDQMQNSFNDNTSNASNDSVEDYIVPPMDTYVRVVRHKHITSTNGRISKRETYEVSLNLDRVSVNLSTNQYRDLLAIFENQRQRHIKRQNFHRIFLKNQSSLSSSQQYTSKSSDVAHKRYITLYNTFRKSKSVKDELKHLERDILDIDTIMSLRDEAESARSEKESGKNLDEYEDGGFGFSDFMDVFFGASEETNKIRRQSIIAVKAKKEQKKNSDQNNSNNNAVNQIPYLTIGFSLYKGSMVLLGDDDEFQNTKKTKKNFNYDENGDNDNNYNNKKKNNTYDQEMKKNIIAKINYGGEAKVKVYQNESPNNTLSVTDNNNTKVGAMDNTAEAMLWDFKMELLDFEILDGGDDGLKILSFENFNENNDSNNKSLGESMSRLTRNSSSEEGGPIMTLSFTSAISDARPNVLVKLKFKPITVYYSFDFFERLGEFQNTIPKNQVIEKAAYETLENIQVWAEQEVSELVANKTKIDIEVKILSPRLIIPVSSKNHLTISLGHLKAIYGESNTDSNITTTTIRLGHLEIDDEKYDKTSFEKLATSKTLSESEDLVQILATRNANIKKLTIHVVFHQLELQWNADTIRAVMNRFTSRAVDVSPSSAILNDSTVMSLKSDEDSSNSEKKQNSSLHLIEEDENLGLDVISTTEMGVNELRQRASSTDSTSSSGSSVEWLNNFSIDMKSVSLTLNKEKISRHIIKLKMTDTKLQIDTQGTTYFAVKGTLGNLSAKDLCTKDTKHEMIIDNYRQSESLLQFSYQTMPDDHVTISNNTSNFTISPHVKVGKHLNGSGKRQWKDLPDAIAYGAKYGNIPGKNLFYIQHVQNKVYYYGAGDESGVSGPDTWNFQDTSDDNKIKITSRLDVELSGVKVVYLQALSMELIDYVFQAMLPAAPEEDNALFADIGEEKQEEEVQGVKVEEKFVIPPIIEAIAVDVKLNNINLILPIEANATPSFKLAIPSVNIICEYSFSPIPLRDRTSRRTKQRMEGIVAPTRRTYISFKGVNVYNDNNDELLDSLKLKIEVIQPLLDAFHVEATHKKALHLLTTISISKLKAKISNLDYCQLVDVLYKNFSTYDEDLYSSQSNLSQESRRRASSALDESFMSPASKKSAVQYYYGQSDVVFPFAQGCEINFEFISLNLVENSNREELIGLFLMEIAQYNLVMDAEHMLTSFSALSLQALNSWPNTILEMINFFSIEDDEDKQNEEKIGTDEKLKSEKLDPLKINNLLPCDLYLEMKVGKTLKKEIVKTGESLPILFDAVIRLRIDGCRWSKGILFQPFSEINVELEDLTYVDGTITVSAKMTIDSIDITTLFWFVNHTQLDLQFSDGHGICSLGPSPHMNGQDPTSTQPRILQKKTGASIKIRVNDGRCRWSKPFECERAGTHQSILWDGMENRNNRRKIGSQQNHKYEMYVSIDSGPYLNRLGLTRIISIHPTYLIVNESVDAVNVCQRGTQEKVRCLPMQPVPMYFNKEPYICLAKDKQHWSPAVLVNRPSASVSASFKVLVDWRGARQLLIRILDATNTDRLLSVGKSRSEISNESEGIVEMDGGWNLMAATTKGSNHDADIPQYIFTLELMFKKIQIHLLNDKQRVVSVTLQKTYVKSHTTNELYELNAKVHRVLVENKVEKDWILVSSSLQPFLNIHLLFDTNKAYSSHMRFGNVEIAPIEAKTSEDFLQHMQMYFISAGKREKVEGDPLHLYVENLQRFHHNTSEKIDRAFVERLEISPLSLNLSFRRKYNENKDRELLKVGGVPLADVIGVKTNFDIVGAPIKIDPIIVFNLEGSVQSLQGYLGSLIGDRVLKVVSLPMLFAHSDVVENVAKDKVLGFFDSIGDMLLPDTSPQQYTFEIVVRGNGKLGIDIAPKFKGNLGAQVTAIDRKNETLIGSLGKVMLNDQLIKLSGVNIEKLPFKTIVQMLKTRNGREMILEFSRLRSPTKLRDQFLDLM